MLAFSRPFNVRVAQRHYFEAGHRYLIEYLYSEDLVEHPAFRPVLHAEKKHYEAEISVYDVSSGKKVLVAPPFEGLYTRLGCIEDKPSYLVHEALAEAQARAQVQHATLKQHVSHRLLPTSRGGG